MPDLNPFDDIGDWISDAIDAVRQVKKSGGVRNATRDVANRAATAGAGGGYAAPARVAASEAALRAYEEQSKRYKDLALLADAVVTGGISDPIARLGAAEVTNNSKAKKKALADLAVVLGINAAGEGAGMALEHVLPKAIQGLGNVLDREIGIHHSMTPALNIIEPSGVRPQTTAMDAIPGYTYFWSTRPGDVVREAVHNNNKSLLSLVEELIKKNQVERSAEGAIFNLNKIDTYRLPEDWWQAHAYMVNVPKGLTSVDENVLRNSASMAARKILGPAQVVGKVNAPNNLEEVVKAIVDYNAIHGPGAHIDALNNDAYAFGNWLEILPKDIVDAVRRAKIERFTKAVPSQDLVNQGSNLGLLARLMARDETRR